MCFSPEVSFISSWILACVWIACIRKNTLSKTLPFAMIPLLFGLHQLWEGFMRLCLWENNTILNTIWSPEIWKYYFFFFSQILRPTRIPLSIYLLEKRPTEKLFLKILSYIGISTSLYLWICLYMYGWVAFIENRHIRYILEFPSALKTFVSILYVWAIILSPLISSNRNIKILWCVLTASLLISYIFYYQYLISVWCLFAAIISIWVYYILKKIHKEN